VCFARSPLCPIRPSILAKFHPPAAHIDKRTTNPSIGIKVNNHTMADLEPSIPAALPADAPISKQVVDPYNVSGEIGEDGVAKAINYSSLIEQFGTKKILEEDLNRFEKVTGHKPHKFMRRGIVFSHRDLNLILDRHERGEPFFLYTGRGPSSDSMHIGHAVPFDFTK
jgi:tryptophanyl-tRNA synthetase